MTLLLFDIIIIVTSDHFLLTSYDTLYKSSIHNKGKSISQSSVHSSIVHLLPHIGAEHGFPCLSITGPAWRPQRGWNEVNKWQTNRSDGGRPVLDIIPGCRGAESGPDVFWVTPGGSAGSRGHTRVAPRAPHGTQLDSPSREAWPLTPWPSGTRLSGMRGGLPLRSSFHFLPL